MATKQQVDTERLQTMNEELEGIKQFFQQSNKTLHLQMEQELFQEYTELTRKIEAIQHATDLSLEYTKLHTKQEGLTQEVLSLQKSMQESQEGVEVLQKQRVAVLDVANLDAYEQEITQQFQKIQKEQQTLYTRIKELQVQQHATNQQIQKLQERVEEITRKGRELEDFNGVLVAKTPEDLEVLYSLYKRKVQTLQEQKGSLEKELEIDRRNKAKFASQHTQLKAKQEHFFIYVKLNDMIGSAKGDLKVLHRGSRYNSLSFLQMNT
jgi:exonuclease SbcC